MAVLDQLALNLHVEERCRDKDTEITVFHPGYQPHHWFDAQVPSNLQGLYEVRYSGDKLDSDVTIKLLQAISDIKNYHLPN
jgi:hypothetical protein